MPHPSRLRVRVFSGSAGFVCVRNSLKRLYGQGHLHFITFSCYRRRPLLGTARARDRFVRILDEVRERHGFALIGFVVMPEHVHLLISESKRKNPSKILQVLKQKVARAVLEKRRLKNVAQLSLPFAGAPEESDFWQRRFYDFNVWSEKKLKEEPEYMHANPVARKLVQHPKDWRWSSWASYSGMGKAMIRIDSVRTEGTASQNPHP